MAIAVSRVAVNESKSFQVLVVKNGTVVENKLNAYFRPSIGTMAGWRDKDRFKTYLSTGYLPQYSYSKPVYIYYDKELAVCSCLRYGETRTHSSALFLPTFADQQGQLVYTDLQPSVEVKALGNLNSQVRNQYYSVVETFYEGKKTARMFTKAASATLRAVRLIRKGDFLTAARTLGLKTTPKGVSKGRSLEQNWLEYRYGWGPIYQTIYGEMKRTYDHMKVKHTRVYQKVGYAESAELTSSVYTSAYQTFVPGSSWTPFFKWRIYATTTRSVQCQYKAIYEINNPGVVASTELGITNPALLALEAIPLSFIADWFSNVSDCFAQLDTWAGKSYKTGTKTVVRRSNQTRTPDMVSAGTGITLLSKNSPKWFTDRVETIRTIVSTPPLVPLRFEVSLSVKRVADAAALIKQILL